MIDARFVPLDRWPMEPTKSKRPDPFRTTYLQTLDLLESELRHLRANEVLIQAFFTREQLRNDGWPKTTAAPREAGVILSFKSRGKPLSFPCDRYQTFDGNMRALALSLQALRAVDRYGVTKHAEQYQGWTQIDAAPLEGFRSKEDAASFIASQMGYADPREGIRWILSHPDNLREAYRNAARTLHPDNNGGSDELFKKLQQAKAILERPGA